MQIVSTGDNLHEMSNSVSWEKYFKMSSAENFTKNAKRLIEMDESIQGNLLLLYVSTGRAGLMPISIRHGYLLSVGAELPLHIQSRVIQSFHQYSFT